MSINQEVRSEPGDGPSRFVRSAQVVAGALVIGLGCLSLVFPLVTGLAAALSAPLLLVAVGLTGLAFEAVAVYRGGSRFDWFVLLFSILYLALGLALASNMFEAVFAFSVFVAAGFLVQAVAAAVAAFLAKGHRSWMIVFSICCGLLACLSFSQWPLGSLQLAGISLGVNFICWGLSLGWGDVRNVHHA